MPEPKGRKPDLSMLAPIPYENPDGTTGARWVTFGSLWANKSGVGYSGKVDFWPVGIDGNKVVLMPPSEQPPGPPDRDAPPQAGRKPNGDVTSRRRAREHAKD